MTFVRHAHNAQQRSALYGAGKNTNLIVISAESLNSFPVGLWIAGQAVTPRLQAFAKESLNFVRFYDDTYLGTTSDGEFISLNSLHPASDGSVVFRYKKNHYRALPMILARNGYNTVSAAGEPPDFWDMENAHLRYGIQRSFFERDYRTHERIASWLADKPFFEQTARILAAQNEPFMAFVLSSSNHHPYILPEEYQTLNVGPLQGTLLGRYLQSVHYFDGAFGAFVDALRSSGLLERTVIAVYGDHEGFVSNERMLADLLHTSLSKFAKFLVRKSVPFMVRLPKGQSAGSIDTPGGHMDVAPTLLDLLGITDPDSVMLGRNLLRPEAGRVVFRDGSFIDRQHTLINQFGPITACVCFDRTGQETDCRPLRKDRDGALEELETSDLIMDGDLVPRIADFYERNRLATDQQ